MDFEQACAYLSQSLTFGIRLGLHRMERLMALLGNPERHLRCIHIAGTNGKGSVSSYCAAVLASAGYHTGIFTSPYLTRLTERIRVINGRKGLETLLVDEAAGEISPSRFAAIMTRIKAAVEVMLAEGEEHPTEFELLTAAGFMHFNEEKCEVVVLETGLGGRLDSTNIITEPLACIITALGFDHMDRLGGTMAEIAAEKAGIIKAGVPVFFYDPDDLALRVEDREAAASAIRRRCRDLNCPLVLVRRGEIDVTAYSWEGQTFTDNMTGLSLTTSLLGLFQPQNAILAARACRMLDLATDTQIRDGIALARWPARLEVLRRQPPVLLDGAHNPQGCQSLADALARLFAGQKVFYLTGMLMDKAYEEMLRLVLANPHCRPAGVVCVRPDSPRALPAEQLAVEVRKIIATLHPDPDSGYNVMDVIHAADNPADGARLALKLAGQHNAALCAFGSLYMAGSIRSILTEREEGFWTGKG